MSQEEMDMADELNNELTKAYLGGLLDGTGSITVKVSKSDDYSFGFMLEPEVQVSKSRPHSIQIMDDWTAANGIFGSANKYRDRFQFRMNKERDIMRLLEILRPYIQDRAPEVQLLAEEILPKMQEGYHLESKENFVEVVELIDELKELASSSGSSSQYNADFFREKWADDLDG